MVGSTSLSAAAPEVLNESHTHSLLFKNERVAASAFSALNLNGRGVRVAKNDWEDHDGIMALPVTIE